MAIADLRVRGPNAARETEEGVGAENGYSITEGDVCNGAVYFPKEAAYPAKFVPVFEEPLVLTERFINGKTYEARDIWGPARPVQGDRYPT